MTTPKTGPDFTLTTKETVSLLCQQPPPQEAFSKGNKIQDADTAFLLQNETKQNQPITTVKPQAWGLTLKVPKMT